LSNVNLTQAVIAGAASAVGAGAIGIVADFYKSEALATANSRQAGDLFARAQAAAALTLAKKNIGDELPYKPFKNPNRCGK
jgi:NADPH:quinone reductase-like Zn-dependent oxidoreductase